MPVPRRAGSSPDANAKVASTVQNTARIVCVQWQSSDARHRCVAAGCGARRYVPPTQLVPSHQLASRSIVYGSRRGANLDSRCRNHGQFSQRRWKVLSLAAAGPATTVARAAPEHSHSSPWVTEHQYNSNRTMRRCCVSKARPPARLAALDSAGEEGDAERRHVI